MDELKEVNLGIVKHLRPTFINTNLSPEEERNYMELLMVYRDIFSWFYDEMSGLDQRVVIHQLVVKNRVKPIKQVKCHFHPELISYIEVEVNKIIQVGFIHEVKYHLDKKKRMDKPVFTWIFKTLKMFVSKITFHFQSSRSLLMLP